MRATTAFNKPFFARVDEPSVHRIDDGGKEKEEYILHACQMYGWMKRRRIRRQMKGERNSCSQSETSLALSFPKDRKLCRDPVYSSIPAFRRIKTSSILFVASF